MSSAEVGTGGDSSRHEAGSSRHDSANPRQRPPPSADEPPTWLANRLATGLALEVAATNRGHVAATSVPSPSDRRASAIGSERERDIGGVRETKDEPLETRAELPSSIELGDLELGEITAPSSIEWGDLELGEISTPSSIEWGDLELGEITAPSPIEWGEGSVDVGALSPASEPCEGWVESALPSSMEWGEDEGMTRGGLPARLPCADVTPAGRRAPC